MIASLQPPLERVANSTAQTVLLLLLGSVLAVLFAWGLREWKVGGRPMLILCLIGGGMAASLEAMWDEAGRLYVYERGARVAFTVAGRGMAWWVVLSYSLYLGLDAYLFYRLASGGRATRRTFWRCTGLIMGLNAVMEIPMTRMGLYQYFGPQALNPTGFPLHYLIQNFVGAAAAGIVFARFPDLVRGVRILFVVLLVPSFFLAGEIFVGWPTYLALAAAHSSYPLVYAAVVPNLLIGLVTLRYLANALAANPGSAIDLTDPLGAGVAARR